MNELKWLSGKVSRFFYVQGFFVYNTIFEPYEFLGFVLFEVHREL